jgi:Fe2+ or Zn2+ uptake regulation protein
MSSSQTADSDLLNAIEDRGYRITSTRRVIAGAIEETPDGFTAEQICDRLPNVGRATVYRAIKLFQAADVVCKLALPDGAPRYAVDTGGRHHHHAICTGCGAVQDFRVSTMERVLTTIKTDVEGQITGHRMEIYVTCPACLASAG